MRALRIAVVVLVATFAAPPPAIAFNSSAWTRPQNQLWTLLSFGRVVAGRQYLPDGTEQNFIQSIDGNTFFDESFYAQIEYGLTDWLTLNTSLPFKRISIERESFFTKTEAFGNVYLGFRLGIFQLLDVDVPFVWSIEVGGWLPTGYTRNLTPSVGAGNIDFDVKTGLGYGFRVTSWLPMYVQLGGGIRARSTAFALSRARDCNLTSDVDCVIDARPNFGDELMYLGEVGTTPFNGSILLFGKIMGTYSLLEPDVGFTAANPIPTRQRFTKIGVGSFLYPLRFFGVRYAENVGLGVQYYSTVDGRNVPKTDDLFLGVEYKHQF
jgi:hypothetical protein